jgi:hypothetical protein
VGLNPCRGLHGLELEEEVLCRRASEVLARGGAIIRKESTRSDDSRRVTLSYIDLVKVKAVAKRSTLSQ